MINKIVKGTLVAASLFVVLVGYQFYVVMADTEQQRLSALGGWAIGDEGNSKIAEQFIEACMKGGPVDADSRPEKLVSVYECANEIGGSDLETLIRTTDQKTKAPAPLRWL
ncbi:hypothetical protein [Marinobacter sp. P4B1]|uniref:hypothetical protein n=1 Tax=Marinobacter sp. P4B1 TaxID=1119533 RepID=UPI00071E276B|nr:hypothetical protein [Marinobacter sp. P4B1]KRW83779.1 hypothetical protein AQ621_17160 [Marinobacter sp. P4B1]